MWRPLVGTIPVSELLKVSAEERSGRNVLQTAVFVGESAAQTVALFSRDAVEDDSADRFDHGKSGASQTPAEVG